MTTYTQKRTPGEYIMSGADGGICEDVATLTASQGALEVGTVLARVTSTGHLIVLNPAASTGAETAVAVLHTAVANVAATQQVVATARLRQVREADLVFPSGISAPNKALAIANLAKQFIIVR
jgi:Bacteriophage lambda head decoration protein D